MKAYYSIFFLFLLPLSIYCQDQDSTGVISVTFDKCRIAISGGLGYRLGITRKDVTPELRNYLDKTHLGFVMNAGASYYFHRRWGCGVNYTYFLSRTSMDTYISLADGTSGYGEISDIVQTHFIGPSIHRRYTSPAHHRTYLIQLAGGYLAFRDQTRTLSKVILYRGHTFGLLFITSIDFRISSHVVIGVECSFIYGVLSKYTKVEETSIIVVELEKPYYSNQCSVNLTLGFRFWR